ncbi:unnamed protein product [Echinostoma caproni]|uniref:Ubiquitin carboxyl-terminal hydrolase n=1 Tax=Echinostoma caproni TaxID=27848 RepID=A0A183B2U9_9TREM|nr:unnamed protein product [Echinostoma caproni]
MDARAAFFDHVTNIRVRLTLINVNNRMRAVVHTYASTNESRSLLIVDWSFTDWFVESHSRLCAKGSWKFHDVLGLDEEHLKTITGQVAAVLLLFPRSEAEQNKKLGEETEDSTVTVIKQAAENACGTVAIFHALINNNELIPTEPGSHLESFVSKTSKMTPEERGKALEQDKTLFELHESAAQEGQTKTPSRESDVQQHYVCFIHHKGHLYELDGRRVHPISHGKTTESTLLTDAAKVIEQFVARDAGRVNFSVLALSS